MSEFINTRDEIGDQATVDGLVEHSLTELKEEGIATLPVRVLYYNPSLQFVEFPNIQNIKDYALSNCSNLEAAILGKEGFSSKISLYAYCFGFSKKLKHLVINSSTMASCTGNSLMSTPIQCGNGAIYVPENLVNTYKTSTAWKTYFITKLQDYPLKVFESIFDSWSTILSNPSYATAYAVRDTKIMELTDGTKIKMDLAAIDTDLKSDDSGTAKMTWICHGVPYKNNIDNTNDTTGGWITRNIYTFLQEILDKIPTEIKSHIVAVKKTYRTKAPNDETLSSDESIWIPSYKEVGFANASYVESDGVVYSDLFPDNQLRTKYDSTGATYGWWLRSASDATNFRCVSGSGNQDYYGAKSSYGVVFGFCTD